MTGWIPKKIRDPLNYEKSQKQIRIMVRRALCVCFIPVFVGCVFLLGGRVIITSFILDPGKSSVWFLDPGSRDPGPLIRDPRPGIPDPGSRIPDHRSWIPAPRSGIQGPGTGVLDAGSRIRDPGSGIREPGSRIRDPGSHKMIDYYDPFKRMVVPRQTP